MEKDYIKEQFVTYEIALKFKELGFDEECFGYYHSKDIFQLQHHLPNVLKFRTNSKIKYLEEMFPSKPKDSCVAPLWQQVIDWFRKKHNIHISTPNYYDGWIIDIRGFKQNINIKYHSEPGMCLEDYEQAREQAILKVIELCKEEK